MNFLAHAVLAGSQRQIVAGSLMGDFVKGVVHDGDYPTELTLGIRLHRRIDAFSNSNEDLKRSARRLPDSLRRIAPPCIDMLADHLLAKAAQQTPGQWLPDLEQGTPPSLGRYEEHLHQILDETARWQSAEAKRFFDHAQASRLFAGYADFDRASKGIGYVCDRLGRSDVTGQVIAAMSDQSSELTADFACYWPQLIAEANRFLAEHGSR